MAESSTSGKSKVNSKTVRTYECSRCRFSALNPESLAIHLLRHLEVKTTYKSTHICALCPYSGKTPDALKKHEYSHNAADPNSKKIPKFSCELCPSFSSDSSEAFSKHNERHSQVGTSKTYACEGCSFTCRSYGSLQKHVRTCVDCIINEMSTMSYLDTHEATREKYPNRLQCFYCKKWFHENDVDYHHAIGCSRLADFMNEP